MAILTVDELIEKKEMLDERRQQLYEIETSIGTFLCKQPTASIIAQADKIKEATASNAYLLMECIVEPNLKDSKLQKALGAFEPLEVIGKIFKPGEIVRVVDQVLEISGYRENVTKKLHELVKN